MRCFVSIMACDVAVFKFDARYGVDNRKTEHI